MAWEPSWFDKRRVALHALVVAAVAACSHAGSTERSGTPDHPGGGTCSPRGNCDGGACSSATCDAAVAAAAQPLPQVSGSRLRAEYWDFDGLRVPYRFYDTMRGEECAFETYRGSDGVHYCVPSASTEDYVLSVCPSAADAFGKPVSRRYVIHEPADACAEHVGVFDMVCTPYSDGDCMPSKGAVIDPTTLAAAREAVDPGGGRIHSYSLVSDDGARLLFGGWDTGRGVAAAPLIIGQQRWAPAHYAFGELVPWADSSCTEHAGGSQRNGMFCPLDAVVGFGGIAEAGASLGVTYLSNGDDCIAAKPDGQHYVGIGAPIDFVSLETSLTVEVGGRLRQKYFAGGDGVPVMPVEWDGVYQRLSGLSLWTFHDTELDEDCQLVIETDGSALCLPPPIDEGYADPACTQPAAYVLASSFQFAPKALTRTNLLSPCGQFAHRVFAIGASLGKTGYAQNNGTCAPASFDAEWFSIGAEIPLSEFATAELVRE